jgi:uncharacterized membrane protein YdbT with pleckstrin-like domain
MSQEPSHIEMTIEGEFASPPPPAKPPLATRVLIWATVVAVVAAACVVAIFALWLLAFLIPIAVVTALFAYLAFRFHLWRTGGSISGGTFRWERRR